MTSNKFTHVGLDWIPHTPGDPMPCQPDTLVRVLTLSERQDASAYENSHYLAKEWDWSVCGMDSKIGWHPIEEQPSLARRVLDLLESGDIEQAKHELRKELE